MIRSANLNRVQISSLAETFAKATSFYPGKTEIIPYITETLKGNIAYTDNKMDSSGGSIVVDPENRTFTIFLPKTTPEKRDVFTIAHELGHYVLHSRIGQIAIKASRSKELNVAEKEANTFAASFLMPENMVKAEFSESQGDIEALAKKFKVSYTTMLWRCDNLGLKNA